MVDRSNAKSRAAVYQQVQDRLKQGFSICIFPEGGVPDESVVLDRFKDGAFKMAIQHKIPILPMTFLDCKKRFSWTFFSGGPGILRVVTHNLVETGILELEDTRTLREEVRTTILQALQKKKAPKRVPSALTTAAVKLTNDSLIPKT